MLDVAVDNDLLSYILALKIQNQLNQPACFSACLPDSETAP